MGNLARALDERHKVMHSSGKSQDTTAQAIRPYNHNNTTTELNWTGKSNGFWQASENMGCDLRRFNFSTLFSLLNWFGYTLQRVVLPPHAITITMHNSPGWFVKIVSTLSKDDHGRVSCSVLEQWYLGFSSRRRWFRWWRWWLGWWRWRGLVGLTLLLYILSCLELIIHLLYFPLKYPIKIQSIF